MKDLDFNRILARYLVGFGVALLLSVLGYLLVTKHLVPSGTMTMALLLLLAAVQLAVQLICFLHLGIGGRSRDRTITLAFTIVMMLIVIIGSLWVLQNLNYRMTMSGQAMDEYMQKQNKKGF